MIVRARPTPVRRSGSLRKLLVEALGVLSYPHHPDRYLELADPLLVTSANNARITDVDRSATDSLTITVRPAQPCRPLPGQCVTVSVRVDGVRHTRCYSPTLVEAESKRRPDLRFTIGRHPEGTVSRHLHDRAQVGDVIELGSPAGEFVLPSPRPRRLLFVAAGSGLTPVLSMLSGLVAEGYDGCAVLLYYTRTPGHVPRRAELDALADRPNIEIVHAHTRSDDGLLQGRFDRSHLAAVAPWYADTPTFVCGPAEMVAGIREVYAEQGAETMVNTEEFVLAPPVVSTDDAGGEISFAESGVVAQNTGSTLLEQAEAAGLTPEHGCRMGICHSCTAVRLSGCTRDVRTGDVDSEPGRRIQICVNAPVGDVAVEL
ncbi:ferredoxin reductase [Rhodococcus pyridinivorans]|uniref:ferredoxin reductase n=1 Tax=Rhodococcus TaxID=1827 RepID=UPI00090430B0|nr:ferredoxin reductase [Rhodococcus sp. 2G]APE08635.1 hypothetical protein BO226_04885 [Rhodococcus sp. 2G]